MSGHLRSGGKKQLNDATHQQFNNSSFYLDIVSVQQPHYTCQREPGFPNPVGFRVDGVVERRAEIGFFEVGAFERGTSEVAVDECRSG